MILHRFIRENITLYKEMSPSVVTWIPSTRRAYDPMEWIAGKVFKRNVECILESTGEVGTDGRRMPDLSRFRVVDNVEGQNVLVLDDLMTSGSHLFSAAGSLKKAGAAKVGAITLGRFVRASDYPDYKKAAKKKHFKWRWASEEAERLF